MSGPESFLARRGSPELQSPLGAVDKAAPTAEPFDFDHAVFVVWRPWESCNRCYGALKRDELVLPEDGDYVCPHTMMKQYKELLAKRSARLCEFPAHESVTLKNGVIQISVSIAWRKAKETAATGDSRVKPPNTPPRPPVL